MNSQNIQLAKFAGFCYGVKRAVETAVKLKKENPDIAVITGDNVDNEDDSNKTKNHIDKLMNRYNVERLHFVGVDMLSYISDDRLDLLSDREFEEYMKFLSNLCEREDCVGLSIHMLDIFKKN